MQGHDVLAASPNSGVNTVTGEGVDDALAGAEVVIDLANSPSFEEKAAMDFFEAAGRNLFAAEKNAGVRHHVALSVVGTDRMQAMGYFRAKLTQEEHIRKSGIPYTIVHATQFFEFVGAIAQSATKGSIVRSPTGAFQPIAADNVADAVAKVAVGEPLNGTIEIAGPDRAPMNEFIGRFLKATNDPRTVMPDPKARYFEVSINDRTLVPDAGAHLGAIGFDEWLKAYSAQQK